MREEITSIQWLGFALTEAVAFYTIPRPDRLLPLGRWFFLAAEEGGGSFLVSPSAGLMIWTLIAFGTTAYILNKVAFPRIAEAIDKRRRAIEESTSTRPSGRSTRPTSCSRSTAPG